MKRNSQKKRNIRRSSLKQKKKVQHGGDYTFTYKEIIKTDGTDGKFYANRYFVELLSKIIQNHNVYDLLTMFKETNASSKKQITLGQFQNVLKTFFLAPREIGQTNKLRFMGFVTDSKTVNRFITNTGITHISGLQMAILYGRYELIKDLFY